MNDIIISAAALEAGARAAVRNVEERHSGVEAYKVLGFADREAFIDVAWPNYVDQTRAAFLAMINAWSGSYSLAENDSAEIREVACIILPLPPKIDKYSSCPNSNIGV